MIYSGVSITFDEDDTDGIVTYGWSAHINGHDMGAYVEIHHEEDKQLFAQALTAHAKNTIDLLQGLDPYESAYRRLEELEEEE